MDAKSIYFSCDLELGDIFGLTRINNFKIYEESFNKWDDKLVLGGMKVSKKERLIVVNSEISSKMKNFIFFCRLFTEPLLGSVHGRYSLMRTSWSFWLLGATAGRR